MKSKLIYSAILAMTLGTVSGISVSFTSPNALAKTKLARVISYKKLSKTSYNVNKGYLYTNPRLNKKAHRAANYLSWTFYATESAKVKKANGKEATYYYLKSGNNKVKGWIWKGNLSKVVVSTNNNTNNNTSNSGSSGTTQSTNDYAQQKSDISNMLSIVRTMYSQDQDDVLADFENITPKAAYDSGGNDLSEVISDMGEAVNLQSNSNGIRMDAQAIQNAYQLFANRFPSLTSIKLAALSSRLSDTLSGKSSDDVSDAAYNLADELSDAVLNLQS
ncbi:hypothetical protein [Lentilactobacillus parakefiri]|uniref:D-alanyl-D-alanine carboxypeptidase n=1 Tax=Lentilactobacillus parakefiri TaxID=152332 RepID=A0A224VIK9_9LACO|nr:hypothetical protein [Lentilactobacillus parakefiri]KRL66385.1 hypothetical protein FD08_GL001990 [Lentilactobacillus parakefiri DSM 10551]PAK99466.1 hypothetical protein B8W96_11460 [Lentilactobacillus parakefiri]TDG91879.1 hypothetical protein C5L28_002152 [Lentilactobacillus parakefiri]GAW72352.1 hypothetical protein LPKJCM_01466 [Lentilactobacillus parakefiri]